MDSSWGTVVDKVVGDVVGLGVDVVFGICCDCRFKKMKDRSIFLGFGLIMETIRVRKLQDDEERMNGDSERVTMGWNMNILVAW